jgi:hypothetical protein
MKYREFGRRTGWRVSETAFGGWQLGGDWGPSTTPSRSKQVGARRDGRRPGRARLLVAVVGVQHPQHADRAMTRLRKCARSRGQHVQTFPRVRSVCSAPGGARHSPGRASRAVPGRRAQVRPGEPGP